MSRTKITTPPPSEEEKALQAEILEQLKESRALQQAFLPMLLQTSGFQYDDEGNLVRMPYEQYLETLDPIMKQQYENLALIQEQTAKALRGEADVSPALEQQLAQQERALQETMSRRLGSRWEETTTGIQAKKAFEEQKASLLEQARYGQLSTYGTLGQQMLGGYTFEPSRQLQVGTALPSSASQLVPMYQSALQPYQMQRQMQMQAQMARAQQGNPLMGALGTAAGIGGGVWLGRLGQSGS